MTGSDHLTDSVRAVYDSYQAERDQDAQKRADLIAEVEQKSMSIALLTQTIDAMKQLHPWLEPMELVDPQPPAVLAGFRRVNTKAAVMDYLAVRGDWVRITEILKELRRTGAVPDEDASINRVRIATLRLAAEGFLEKRPVRGTPNTYEYRTPDADSAEQGEPGVNR